MVGPNRSSAAFRAGWTAIVLSGGALVAGATAGRARAQAPVEPAPAPKAEAPPAPAQPKPDLGELFDRPGTEPPRPFVPLNAQSVEDRKRVEAVRLYSAARALEDRRAYADAVDVLQQAFKLDPDSVAIARRLSRLYVGPLARPDLAVEFGKRALAADPSDTETLERLFQFHLQRNELKECESLLQEVLANPKLEPHAPGRIVAWFELGRLYSTGLNDPEKAADAYAKVVAELDDKESNKLKPAEIARILGNEPAVAYLGFGLVFLAAKRDDLAVKAFERGLVYDETNPQIPLLLAETYLKSNQGDRALALVDRFVKRQPQGIEAYELLARVLKALNREDQITPRLEEAAQRDSKNVPLQYVLADRYRETGQVEKAEALYKTLLASQPTPQTYRALAASLVKRKKAGDLLKVLCEAVARPQGAEAVGGQLQAIASDDALAEEMLDEGFKQLAADPPGLPQAAAFRILGLIALPDRRDPKPARLERLLKLQRLLLDKSPNPTLYLEVIDTEQRLTHYAEAAAMLEKMLAEYPGERKPRFLAFLASFYHKAGRDDKALENVREAIKLGPNEAEERRQAADLLAELGRVDEAVPIYEKLIKDEPGNPTYEFLLGGLLTKYGRHDEAVKHFREMLTRNAGNLELAKLIHSNLSIVYVNQGDYAKGEAELEAALERFPEDPGVNNDLGYLYADQGKNLDKAEAMIRKALKEDPDNYAYLDSLGWALFKQGKLKEAVEPLQKAVELHREAEKRGLASPDATLPDHLGDVFLQLQEVEKARTWWREAEQAAARSEPHDKRLDEIRKKLTSLDALEKAPKASTGLNP
ncbi:tetratricopeptide repeat protein [Paludisphaera mucosa]|uniref:Tetratricopeptide repeat protein n=1 Tax=Paludisphaera mucosa TaxID=3030827 RepID=A0ABT6FC42_9BACT|nr:tetratricopeptide repeat protein [Paludisphaera mucosa]MDG3005114.1 tetratricopeptide repeat protein [Paludisphaera mucosa]